MSIQRLAPLSGVAPTGVNVRVDLLLPQPAAGREPPAPALAVRPPDEAAALRILIEEIRTALLARLGEAIGASAAAQPAHDDPASSMTVLIRLVRQALLAPPGRQPAPDPAQVRAAIEEGKQRALAEISRLPAAPAQLRPLVEQASATAQRMVDEVAVATAPRSAPARVALQAMVTEVHRSLGERIGSLPPALAAAPAKLTPSGTVVALTRMMQSLAHEPGYSQRTSPLVFEFSLADGFRQARAALAALAVEDPALVSLLDEVRRAVVTALRPAAGPPLPERAPFVARAGDAAPATHEVAPSRARDTREAAPATVSDARNTAPAGTHDSREAVPARALDMRESAAGLAGSAREPVPVPAGGRIAHPAAPLLPSLEARLAAAARQVLAERLGITVPAQVEPAAAVDPARSAATLVQLLSTAAMSLPAGEVRATTAAVGALLDVVVQRVALEAVAHRQALPRTMLEDVRAIAQAMLAAAESASRSEGDAAAWPRFAQAAATTLLEGREPPFRIDLPRSMSVASRRRRASDAGDDVTVAAIETTDPEEEPDEEPPRPPAPWE